jgi:hypothetical protein
MGIVFLTSMITKAVGIWPELPKVNNLGYNAFLELTHYSTGVELNTCRMLQDVSVNLLFNPYPDWE